MHVRGQGNLFRKYRRQPFILQEKLAKIKVRSLSLEPSSRRMCRVAIKECAE